MDAIYVGVFFLTFEKEILISFIYAKFGCNTPYLCKCECGLWTHFGVKNPLASMRITCHSSLNVRKLLSGSLFYYFFLNSRAYPKEESDMTVSGCTENTIV